jgi:hypothetical protein
VGEGEQNPKIDEIIASVVQTRVTKMTDHNTVTEKMRLLVQDWKAASDRRAIFLHCYWLMTCNMLEAIQTGEFRDRDWVSGLLHRFTDYYFDALSAYEQSDPATPAIWLHAHQAARSPEVLVLQNLFLGINAHINYDLVLTLVEVLDVEWDLLDDEQRKRRYADHCLVIRLLTGRSIGCRRMWWRSIRRRWMCWIGH